MAQSEVYDDTIHLKLKFAFHHKQLSQPKNADTLKSLISKQSGDKYQLVIEKIDDDQKKQKPSKREIPDYKSISNIFGGHEVLES